MAAEAQSDRDAARELIETNCVHCHGPDGAAADKNSEAFRGFTRLSDVFAYKDLDKLKSIINGGAMPPGSYGSLTDEEKAQIIGGFVRHAEANGAAGINRFGFVSPASINRCIEKDAEHPDNIDAKQYRRYFSFAHLLNPLKADNTRGLSRSELALHVDALNILLNSLSGATELVKAVPIDALGTVHRIDIRDYKWHENDNRALNALTRSYKPFGRPEDRYLRGDWFIGAASQGKLYYDMLPFDVSKGLKSLEPDLGIDLAKAYERPGETVRFAFEKSRVSQNHRVIERHRTKFGSYWKSFDFSSKSDFQDVLSKPFGPQGFKFYVNGIELDIDENKKFHHKGGEFIFTLPNRLQGYLLTDVNGYVLLSGADNLYGDKESSGPTNIVNDYFRSAISHGAKNEVVNAYSCMGCHYNGVIWEYSTVFPIDHQVEAFAQGEDSPEARFLRKLYRNNLEEEVVKKTFAPDRKRYLSALKQVADGPPSGAPVFHVAYSQELELSFDQIAAEFGVTRRALARFARDRRDYDRHREFKRKLSLKIKTPDVSASEESGPPVEVNSAPFMRRDEFYADFEQLSDALEAMSASPAVSPPTARPTPTPSAPQPVATPDSGDDAAEASDLVGRCEAQVLYINGVEKAVGSYRDENNCKQALKGAARGFLCFDDSRNLLRSLRLLNAGSGKAVALDDSFDKCLTSANSAKNGKICILRWGNYYVFNDDLRIIQSAIPDLIKCEEFIAR